MQKNNFIKFISILIISFTLLTACADELMQPKATSTLDKIDALVKKKPSQLQDIENVLGFKFGNIANKKSFDIATASKKELEITEFLSIEYKYRFQKNNPLGLLIMYLKKIDCISKEDIVSRYGKALSWNIPTIHHWSKKEVNNPYEEVAEYYGYKTNGIKLSVGYPVNPKTGMPVDNACASELIINYDDEPR